MLRSILQTYRNAYLGLPREIWVISGALFVNRFGTMVLPFLTLYLTKSKGFSPASAGAMVSIYGFGSVIGTYLGGRLVSRVGAIRLQITLLLLSIPMYLLLPNFGTAVTIGLGLFFLSIFCEGVRPANATAITQFSPYELRTRSFALQRTALNLGVSFGPAIGGFLSAFSFVWLFWADAATTFLCALCLFPLLKSTQRTAQVRRNSGDSEADENASKSGSLQGPGSDPLYLCFLGLILLSAIVLFQFHTNYPLYLSEVYGLSNFQIGTMYAVNTVMIVLFEMILVERIRDWPMVKTIGWGNAINCLGFGLLPFGLFPFGAAIPMVVFSMVVITIGEMLASPIASGWVARRSEGKDQGRYMGWYTTTFSLACVLAPAIGTRTYELDKHLFWYISLVIAVLVLVGTYVLAWQLGDEA